MCQRGAISFGWVEWGFVKFGAWDGGGRGILVRDQGIGVWWIGGVGRFTPGGAVRWVVRAVG